MFWLKSEPILRKIPTLTFSPPPQAVGRKTRRLAGEKSFPPAPFIFRPLAEIPSRASAPTEIELLLEME
jgi:hypothetical protein